MISTDITKTYKLMITPQKRFILKDSLNRRLEFIHEHMSIFEFDNISDIVDMLDNNVEIFRNTSYTNIGNILIRFDTTEELYDNFPEYFV